MVNRIIGNGIFRRVALLLAVGVAVVTFGRHASAAGSDAERLAQWQVGTSVSPASAEKYGLERCFVAERIPDAVWKRMQGKSYKENPYIKRTDLRYLRLLHWDYDGRAHLGEMVCNRQIADLLVDIFRQLYQGKYPIERMVLPDVYDADDERQMRANNSSCFCYRPVAGSQKLSKHARGLAVDLNTLYNPYYKDRKDGTRFVQPATGRPYCDRSKAFRYKIEANDLACRLFAANGFRWGGRWTSCKDFQHFEYMR